MVRQMSNSQLLAKFKFRILIWVFDGNRCRIIRILLSVSKFVSCKK